MTDVYSRHINRWPSLHLLRPPFSLAYVRWKHNNAIRDTKSVASRTTFRHRNKQSWYRRRVPIDNNTCKRIAVQIDDKSGAVLSFCVHVMNSHDKESQLLDTKISN